MDYIVIDSLDHEITRFDSRAEALTHAHAAADACGSDTYVVTYGAKWCVSPGQAGACCTHSVYHCGYPLTA